MKNKLRGQIVQILHRVTEYITECKAEAEKKDFSNRNSPYCLTCLKMYDSSKFMAKNLGVKFDLTHSFDQDCLFSFAQHC